MSRLKNQRCYLVGAIDEAKDLGEGWRLKVQDTLRNSYGCIVYNPLEKPIKNSFENKYIVKYRHGQKALEHYDFVREEMKGIRHEDLRTCDRADFGIIYLNKEIPACGTFEELFTLNRSKKPCLIVFEQGKKQAFDWLFGTVPHEHIFDSFADLYTYLDRVAFGPNWEDATDRWVFWEENNNSEETLKDCLKLIEEWEKVDAPLIIDGKWNDGFPSISDCDEVDFWDRYFNLCWLRYQTKELILKGGLF